MSSFDKLCWFSERLPQMFGPSICDLVRRASLFVFPHVPQDVLPKTYTREELEFQRDFFVLPFPVTAIEDSSSCVMLWDVSDSQGLHCQRFFLEVASTADDKADTWRNADAEREARSKLPKDARDILNRAWSISFGSVKIEDTSVNGDDQWSYLVGGDLFFYHLVTDRGDPLPYGESLWKHDHADLARSCLLSAMTGIEELMVANRPDRFILRDTPAKVRDPLSPKIPRSHERPVYTILHPQEIRSKMGLPPAAPSGRQGTFVGERRRHVRRYPDDPSRWPNMHGKCIVIPATWVGPAERSVGRRTYKVMLDL